MSAVAVGDVHGVVEGAGVDEGGGEAEDDLGEDKGEGVVEEEHEEEGDGEGELGGEEPGGFVVPAGPLPGDEEAGEAGEAPDGGDDADGGEVGEAGFGGEGGFDGEEDVDGDVGEGVADPGHEEEAFGAGAEVGGVEVVFGGGFFWDVVFADEGFGGGEVMENAEAEGAAEGGDEEDVAPPEFFEGAAGEEGDEAGGAPGEVVEGDAGA